MDTKALSETYDIINLMDIEYQNKIPNSLKDFIKVNREVFFDTGIKEFPKSIEKLRRETIVMLSIIYKKYIFGTELDISDDYREMLKEKYKIQSQTNVSVIENKDLEHKINKENELLVKKNGLLNRIKIIFQKIINVLKKKG